MSDIILKVRGLSHWFGNHRVLFDINLDVERGEIIGLVGPSGCGKSTLLRAIVGTHPPCVGSLSMYDGGGQRAITAPGRDRGIVYQRYSLFPHLTALENVAFGLMLDQTNIPFRLFKPLAWRKLRKTHREAAAAMLEKMKLGSALNKYPPEMSGGMCQRVAIAQAMIMKPSILLLDEPFGALDEATREELQKVLLNLNAENRAARSRGEPAPHTIMIVTHEINEAIYVSNRVIGLSQYWNWKEAGETTAPGATVVYDQSSPVFKPEDERDFMKFRQQKEDILRVVFDTKSNESRHTYVSHGVTAIGKE